MGIWSQFERATPATSPNMQGRLVTVHWKNVRKSSIYFVWGYRQPETRIVCHQSFSCFCQVEPEKGLYYWDEVNLRLLDQVQIVPIFFISMSQGGVEHGDRLEGVHGSRHSCMGLRRGGIFHIIWVRDRNDLSWRCQKSDWTAQTQTSTRTTVGKMQASPTTQIHFTR